MSSCSRAQILPNGVNGGVGKPFIECMQDEFCCNISRDIVLEGNIPCKVFSEICVTEVRFLICISVVVRTCLLVTKYLTHSQIWKISVSPKFSRLNVVSVYFIMASSFSSSSFFFADGIAVAHVEIHNGITPFFSS